VQLLLFSEYTGGCQSIPYTQPSCPASTDSRETAKYSTAAVSSCITTLKNFWSGWMSSSKSNSLTFFLVWVATFSSHGVIRHKRIKESCELLARRRWPESSRVKSIALTQSSCPTKLSTLTNFLPCTFQFLSMSPSVLSANKWIFASSAAHDSSTTCVPGRKHRRTHKQNPEPKLRFCKQITSS